MRTFWNINKTVSALREWQPNCWIQITCPNEEDEKYLLNELKIPDYFLEDLKDKDERSRYDFDDGWVLIILRIPYVKEIRSRTPHTTVPMGIIIKKDQSVRIIIKKPPRESLCLVNQTDKYHADH